MAKLDTGARRKSNHAMADARETILKRLEDISWSKWYFATQCEKRGMGTATVMQFLKGPSDTKVGNLKTMLDILGMSMEFVVVSEPKELP